MINTDKENKELKEIVLEKSLSSLDFNSIRELVSQKSTFFRSEKLCLSMKPSYEDNEVISLQKETLEGIHILKNTSYFSLNRIPDISEQIVRSHLGGTLTGQELIEIAASLDALTSVKNSIENLSNDIELLPLISSGISNLNFLTHSIKSKIAPNGIVMDSATPQLGAIRSQVRYAYSRVTNSLERLIQDSNLDGYIQDDVISVRGDRLVIQVKSNMKNQIPGVVHDASNSGMTLFVEPFSTVNLCNTWRELGLQEEREVNSVLRELSSLIGESSQEIEDSLRSATRLDYIIARAKYSESINPDVTSSNYMSNPKILNFDKTINLTNVIHPLIGKNAIPLSITMQPDWKILVITGPNTGGKTVALKTIGLLAAMQQSGILISSNPENNLPIFDGIYADIGDQQNINDSVSTFSSHIRNLTDIIKLSSKRSLVLLDEIGSSTDPEEGAAIASAVLQHFSEQTTTTIATTHHQSVATTAENHSSFTNASFHLDPDTLEPTYQMSVGIPGRSYAMSVASSLGFPQPILEKARRNLSPDYKKVSSMLIDISRDREELSEILLESKKVQTQIISIRKSLRDQLELLIQKRQQIIESVRLEAKNKYQEIEKLLSRAESALSWSKHSSSTNDDLVNIDKELNSIKSEIAAIEIPEPQLKPTSNLEIIEGQSVYIKTLKLSGKVQRLSSGNREAEIKVGTIRMNVKVSDLTISEEDTTETISGNLNENLKRKPSIKIPVTQLDIRGMRAEAALDKVETFLDSSIRDGLSKVRIIHGKGTGALRQAVRENLNGHPLVNEFGREPDPSGGDGATYVLLN